MRGKNLYLTGLPPGVVAAKVIVPGSKAPEGWWLLGLGVGTVVVTCGADGSLVVRPDRVERVPAFTVDVVDTTGCGDAFTAGLVVGLQLGWPLPTAARLATAAAGLVATGLGSDAGIVDLPTTLQWWAERAHEVGAAPPP